MPRTDGLILADAITLVEIAMIIFIVVFLGIVAWVLLARRGHFRDVARIPLEDDRVVTPRHLDNNAEPAADGADDASPAHEEHRHGSR